MYLGIKWKHQVIFAAIAVALIVPFSTLSQVTGWKLVTMPDVWITATAIGSVWSDTQVVAIAEYHAGVLVKYTGTSWQLLTNVGTNAIPMQKRTVNDLLFPSNNLLWAGTDSGLCAYRFTSGIPPAWTMVAGIPADSVFAIRISLGSAFVLTRHDIFRSDDTGRSWRSVRPPDAADLTALAVKDSLCVAGAAPQQLRSPRTVWVSRNFGATWQDISFSPDDASIPSADAVALVWEKDDGLYRIIVASGAWIKFCVIGSVIQWANLANLPLPASRIRDMTTLNTMSWVAVGTDSGTFLFNTIVDFSRWEKPLGHSTYRFAKRDSAGITTLMYAATYDGLWEWSQAGTSISRPVMEVFSGAGTGRKAQTLPAFDLRGRFLGRNNTTGAANLCVTLAGKRLHGMPVSGGQK